MSEDVKGLVDGTCGLRNAAANVEHARMTGIAEHLAGWEQLTIREAIVALEAQAKRIAELEAEVSDCMETIADMNRMYRIRGEHKAQAEAQRDEAISVLKTSSAAMAEYYRYFTGGETRGSYDGKPERKVLWDAMYAARTALAKLERQP